MGAWMHAAIPAFWMIPSALSTTPSCLGLSALVNSCLMRCCLHTSLNSPPKSYPPSSDLTISTFEGTQSARASAKNFLNAFPESGLGFRKYIHAWRE